MSSNPQEDPGVIGKVLVVVMLVADAAAVILSNTYYEDRIGALGHRSYFEDWNWVVDFYLLPVVAFWYIIRLKQIDRFWDQLRRSPVISAKAGSCAESDLGRHLTLKNLSVAAAIVLSALTYIANARLSPEPWWTISVVTCVVRLIGWGLSYYLGAIVVFREISTMLVFHRTVTRATVEYRPYHADKHLGFRFLTDLLSGSTLLVASLGAGIGAWEVWLIANDVLSTLYGWCAHVSLLVYLVLTPFIYLLSLWPVNRRVQYKKQQLLAAIEGRLHSQFSDIQRGEEISSDGSSSYVTGIERIVKTEQIYRMIEDLPVWPIRFRDIWNYIVVVVSALAPLSSILSLVLKARGTI